MGSITVIKNKKNDIFLTQEKVTKRSSRWTDGQINHMTSVVAVHLISYWILYWDNNIGGSLKMVMIILEKVCITPWNKLVRWQNQLSFTFLNVCYYKIRDLNAMKRCF